MPAQTSPLTHVAIEEHFSVPGIGEGAQHGSVRTDILNDWTTKLADFDEFRVPDMDANGIGVQVLSLDVPGVQADLADDAADEQAHRANDSLAEAIRTHPGRFAGFAALPTQNPDLAVAELTRCVTELGFCGALINDHTQGRYLDETRYDGLWEALENLDVPLYIHPGLVPPDRWHVLDGYSYLYGPMWSWGAETAGHAMRILCGGIFDRHPKAKLILGHMGEFLPFELFRLDSRYATLDVPTPLDRRPSEYFGANILVTTSGVFSPAALTGAVLALGADAVMFAVDYPYESSAQAVDALQRTRLSDLDREKIAHGNAERVLKLA